MFESKREEVVGSWTVLHNELHNLYASPNIVRVIKSTGVRCAGHVAHMGEMRNAYKIFIRKPKGKRPLQRPRHR